jgi:hypothetical protein
MSNIFLNTARTPNGISVEWEIKGALPADIAKQIPFAASLAMNRTALEAVAVVQQKIATKFRSRGAQSRAFFEQSFLVTQYSNKRNLEVAFGTSRQTLQGRSAVLLDHETGEDRVQRGPHDFPYIAAMNSLRPGKDDIMPRWAYPKALGLVNSRYTANGKEAGVDRTPKRKGSTRGKRAQENRKGFILREKDGSPIGIFRRIPMAGMRVSGVREGGKKLTLRQRRRRGTGQSTLELLFATPKVIKITPKLGFYTEAYAALEQGIQANFELMLTYATTPGLQEAMPKLGDISAAKVQQFLRGMR